MHFFRELFKNMHVKSYRTAPAADTITIKQLQHNINYHDIVHFVITAVINIARPSDIKFTNK